MGGALGFDIDDEVSLLHSCLNCQMGTCYLWLVLITKSYTYASFFL